MAQQRVSAADLEVLHVGGTVTARISGIELEVLHPGAARARVSGAVLEVLRSVDPAGAHRRIVMVME
jgi:hypothetical protein